MATFSIGQYGARLYKPEIGRFITPDTIVPDYASPQSLNRYAYVLSNPMNHSTTL